MKIFFYLLLFPIVGFSQTYSIKYDVTLRSQNRQGQLITNPNNSSFYYETLTRNNKNPSEEDAGDTLRKRVVLTNKGNRTRYQIYNKDTLYNIDYLGDTKVIVYESLPKINWQLEQETRKIEKFTCNKATTIFRGRRYIAWFTTEIPIHLGPWKFNGLPGAVLQIYDETRSFTWTATRVEGKAQNIEMELDHNLKKITLKEFVIRNEKNKKKLVDEALLKFAGRDYQEISSETKRGRETQFEWE